MKKREWRNMVSEKAAAAVFGAALVLTMAGSALAQEVIFTGEPAPLTVYQSYTEAVGSEDAAVITIEVENLHVLGGVSAGEDTPLYAAVLIPNTFAEESGAGEIAEAADTGEAAETGETPEAADAAAGEMPWITGFVLASEIMEKVPAISFTQLPSVTGWVDISQGTYNDTVTQAQQYLIDMGYLSGEADGQYGPGTAGAVSAFQQEMGLPATGVLNVITYFSLLEKADTAEPMEVPYPPVYTVEDKFDDILEYVEDPSVLEDYVTPEWVYTYEPFDGEGQITDGTVLGTFEDSSRPVDTISLVLSTAMKVQREDTGFVSIYPILQVKSIGAYRPYVKSIILKSGNAVCELDGAVLKGALSGTQVEEIAEIPVTEEALELLQGGTDNLEIRVKGNSRTYDLN